MKNNLRTILLLCSTLMVSLFIYGMEPVTIRLQGDEVLKLSQDDWSVLSEQSSVLKGLKEDTQPGEDINLLIIDKRVLEYAVNGLLNPTHLRNYNLDQAIEIALVLDFLDIDVLKKPIIEVLIDHCKNTASENQEAYIKKISVLEGHYELVTLFKESLQKSIEEVVHYYSTPTESHRLLHDEVGDVSHVVKNAQFSPDNSK